ncbi:MAG: hypothetical protein O2840_02500 [bacterium]|nr:hypothetical protein [bacterium]
MQTGLIERRLYLDIDKTMVDPRKIRSNFTIALAEHCSVSRKKIQQLTRKYLDGLEDSTKFDPRELAEHISARLRKKRTKERAFPSEDLAAIILDPLRVVGATYDDVGVLGRVRRELFASGIHLGIFSQGVGYWQEHKLQHSEIDLNLFEGKLFEIHPDKLSSDVLDRIPAGSAIVDDKEVVVETLAEQRPDIHAIWINRNSKEISAKNGVHTIFSLDELSPLLRRLWLGTDQPTQPK